MWDQDKVTTRHQYDEIKYVIVLYVDENGKE